MSAPRKGRWLSCVSFTAVRSRLQVARGPDIRTGHGWWRPQVNVSLQCWKASRSLSRSPAGKPVGGALARCPNLGAEWERTPSGRRGQTRYLAVVEESLTCADVREQPPRSPACLVRDEEAAGSNPATPTRSQAKGGGAARHRGGASRAALSLGGPLARARRRARRLPRIRPSHWSRIRLAAAVILGSQLSGSRPPCQWRPFRAVARDRLRQRLTRHPLPAFWRLRG